MLFSKRAVRATERKKERAKTIFSKEEYFLRNRLTRKTKRKEKSVTVKRELSVCSFICDRLTTLTPETKKQKKRRDFKEQSRCIFYKSYAESFFYKTQLCIVKSYTIFVDRFRQCMTVNEILFSLLLGAGSLAIGGAFYYVLASWLLKKRGGILRFGGMTIQINYLAAPFRLLFPLLSLRAGLVFLSLSDKGYEVLSQFLSLLLIGLVGWLLARILHMVRDILLERYDIAHKDNWKARRVYTQVRIAERILMAAIFLITVSCMLMTFSGVRQVGVSLLASAGIIGIILGFAAQKILGNLIAGIQLAITQPIRLDDVVIVENEWGRVEEITLIYVVVRLWDLRRLIVPISYFIDHPFQNWTRLGSDIVGSVFFYVDYTTPVQELRHEFVRILQQSAFWDGKVGTLQVSNATEHTIEVRAVMSATDSSTVWDLRCEVREKLLSFLQQKWPHCLPKTRLEYRSTPSVS